MEAALPKNPIQATVRKGDLRGTGTPFQNGKHSFVWTAAHVLDYKIKPSPTVEIAGQEYDAEVVRLSRQHDLALLRLDRAPVPPLPALLVWEESSPPPLGTPIDGRAGYRYGAALEESELHVVGGKAVKGQSGTGLFVDGRYVGMIVQQGREFPEHCCLIVPSSVFIDFSRRLNCRWAVDNSATVPDTVYPLFIGR